MVIGNDTNAPFFSFISLFSFSMCTSRRREGQQQLLFGVGMLKSFFVSFVDHLLNCETTWRVMKWVFLFPYGKHRYAIRGIDSLIEEKKRRTISFNQMSLVSLRKVHGKCALSQLPQKLIVKWQIYINSLDQCK